MIFYFQAAAEQLVALDNRELENVFSALIEADRQGRHFFVATRSVCRWAAENLPLSRQSCEHLQRIGEEHAVRHCLVSNSRVYVSVVIGNQAIGLENERVFSIGHVQLLRMKYLLAETRFIVEDIDVDGRFYEHLLAENQKLGDVPSYKFEMVHGGGSRIPRVFEAELRRGGIVVCVVDHDKLAPMDQLSSSAIRVLREYEKRNGDVTGDGDCFIGIALATVGREAENYIPYSLLREMPGCQGYANFAELDNIVLRAGEARFQDEFWRYFDIKCGICGSDLVRKAARGKMSAEVLSWIERQLECDRDAMEHVNIAGFGQRVIEVFLKSPDTLGRFHQFVRSDIWQHRYVEYFEVILWFFAAPKQVRT